jgi:hypothetical protein
VPPGTFKCPSLKITDEDNGKEGPSTTIISC